MKRLSVFVVYLILISYQCYGSENSTYAISSITKGSNLYSGNIDGLLKDSNGYIWYHSHGSLFQFNGDDWTKLSISGDADKISNNVILHGTLAEDKWQNLWLGNNKGLYYYVATTGQSEKIKLSSNDKDFAFDITHLTVHSDNMLFFLADDKPYRLTYNFNSTTNEIQIESIQSILQDSEVDVKVLTKHSSGNIIFFSNGFSGEYNVKKKEVKWKKLPEPIYLDASPAMSPNIFCDLEGVIWIGTQHYGVYTYDLQTGELSNVREVSGKRIRHIKDVAGDGFGNVWVASTEGIIRMFDQEGEIQSEFVGTSDEVDEYYLQYINSLYCDSDGYLLLLAQGGEVLKLEPRNQSFQFLPINIGFNLAPVFSAFSDIKISPDGKVCKLKRYNRFISEISSFDTNTQQESVFFKYEQPGDQIISFEFIQGQLWLGTLRSGLIIIDEGRGVDSQSLSGFFKNKQIARIVKCSDKLVYFITTKGIVYVVKDEGKGNWTWTQKRRQLQQYTIYATPMIGTSNGWMWCADPLDTLIGFNPDGEEKEFRFIKNIAMSSLYDLSDNNILVGTYSGLRQINTSKGEIKRIESFNNVSVFNIVGDPNDKEIVWMTSYKKLFRFNKKTGKADVIGQDRGLPNCRFSTNSNKILPNGNIGFGTLRKGILTFSPENVEFSSIAIMAKISGIKVNGEQVEHTKRTKQTKIKYPQLDYKYPFAKSIKLKHYQSLITLRFSAFNYKQPQNLMYKYLLEGVDSEWNRVGYNLNEVTYSNLKPGEYTFRIKVTNTPGIWLGEESRFHISIEPAWYQTQTAKVSFIITFLLLAVFFWRYSIGKIKLKEQLKREKAERDKDSEINKQRLQFFTNISHEFKTPLTLLFGPLNQLRKKDVTLSGDEKEHLFDLMSKNISHLMKMINQLMDFRKVSNNAMTLRVRPTNVSRFIEEQYLRFKQEVESQEKTITINNNSGELIYGWVDSEKLLRILDNLLSNAVKFTPANGIIRLDINKKGEGVELQVCDNGVGIAPEHLPHIFDRYYRIEDNKDHMVQVPGTGIGLALCAELAEIMKGRLTVESTPGKGTCFHFWFPVNAGSFGEQEKDIIEEDAVVQEDVPVKVSYKDRGEEERDKPLVLIVEDNKDMQSFIGSVLSNDYVLEYAGNGYEGIEKSDRLAPDLVISDVMMPEMGGFEMVAKLKTDVRISHIPIVLLTALSSAKHQVQGMESGADLYISKPFDPEYLKTSINNLIHSRAQLRQQFGKKLIDIKTSEITITRTDEVFLDNIMKIIGERLFDSDFKIEDIYAEIGMSRSQFFRKIKALTDQTAGDFVKSLRLKKASELLVKEGVRISDVCYEVGFTDPKYFTKVFKKHFGMSPTEYINRRKEVN